jgi:hypothetical protein
MQEITLEWNGQEFDGDLEGVRSMILLSVLSVWSSNYIILCHNKTGRKKVSQGKPVTSLNALYIKKSDSIEGKEHDKSENYTKNNVFCIPHQILLQQSNHLGCKVQCIDQT